MPDRSPYERVALEYCAPRGIPLSEFLHVWSDEDRWAALDWQAEQGRKCAAGHSLDETGGPAQVDKWNADVADHCDLCRAIERAASVVTGHDELNPMTGVIWRVWRDKEVNGGRVDESGAAGREARAAS